jgi:hypothetical protein
MDGVELSASRPGRSLPPGMVHCTGGWVDLGVGLDTEARGKYFSLPGIEFKSSSPLSDTILTELPELNSFIHS